MHERPYPTPIFAEQYNPFQSIPVEMTLPEFPALMKDCFKLLEACGAKHFALFGGAIRDTDYAIRHQLEPNIKDFDIRIWFPKEEHDSYLQCFLTKLEIYTQSPIKHEKSEGTEKIRYVVPFKTTELDISIREIPEKFKQNVPIESVAIDRAFDSDVGISAIAIDPSHRVWAKPEYLLDQKNHLLTVYYHPNHKRRAAYAARMQEKFPHHVLVWHDLLNEVKAHSQLFFNSLFLKRKEAIDHQLHQIRLDGFKITSKPSP